MYVCRGRIPGGDTIGGVYIYIDSAILTSFQDLGFMVLVFLGFWMMIPSEKHMFKWLPPTRNRCYLFLIYTWWFLKMGDPQNLLVSTLKWFKDLDDLGVPSFW